MTAGRPNTLQAPPASADHPEAITRFARAGWTTQEWDDLYKFLTAGQHGPSRPDDGARVLASWLRHPPDVFVNPISPAMVRDLYDRHPKVAGQLLTAIAAGATERFAITFLRASPDITAAVAGWTYARTFGLSEPAATGWAQTGCLHGWRHRNSTAPALNKVSTTTLITRWVERFGPTSYLWVLAGYTLEEATGMQAAGDQVTDQQLRVMAALNGHTLPPGI